MFASPAALFGSLLFGAIGLGAFIYGKKMHALHRLDDLTQVCQRWHIK